MRPIRITAEGFAAFRQPVEVDLSDVDLAVFVGPTGSGKSSIIDAATFALFGQVVRYDDARLVAPAIHTQANEARVSFTFELDEAVYIAARVVRRSKSGVSTKEARLERLSPDPQVLAGRASEMGEAVQTLLGLDFARFTKTVVLPQGRFATFLHDTPADRQELLRDLLDLGQYTRMGRAARQAAQVATNKVEALRPQLESAPSDADVLARQAQVQALGTTRSRLDEHLTAATGVEDQIREADRKLATLVDTEQRLATIKTPPGVADLAARLSAATEARAEATRLFQAANEAFHAADQAHRDGPDRVEIERGRALYQQEVELAAELQTLNERHKSGLAATEEATTIAEATRVAERDLEADVVEAEETVATARAELDELGDRTVLERVKASRAELAELQKQADATAASVDDREAELKEASSVADAAASRFQEVEAERSRVIALGAAGELIESLTVGEPCPICQQSVATLPTHDVDEDRKVLDAKVAQATKEAKAAQKAVADADRSLAVARERREATDARITDLAASLADEPDADAVETRLAEHDKLTATVNQLVSALASARMSLRRHNEDPEVLRARTAEDKARQTLASIASQIETRTKDIARVSEQTEALPALEDLDAQLEQLAQLAAVVDARRSELASATDQQRTAEEAFQATEAAEDEALRAFTRQRDAVAALQPPEPSGDVQARWTELQEWASGQRSEVAAEIEEAKSQSQALATRRRATNAAALELVRGALASDGNDSLRGLPADPDSVDLQKLERRLADAQTQAEVNLATAEAARTQAEAVASQIKELEEAAAVDSQLARLLGASEFERWLTLEVFDALVARATERLLELSKGQYSLEAVDTGIWVRDHHNGDEMRDAKTLSGGETFLASLALALALADSTVDLSSEGAPRIDALFLDEGFGTLDPETLDSVASALEELGSTGRMVVIVTHIRELADRMPVRFEVSKGPTTATVERGSI